MRWPLSRRERIRREAADWVARLNGPHSDDDRAEFRSWYESQPDNARAYDRQSEIFRVAGQLRGAAPAGQERHRTSSRPLRFAFAAALAGAALLAFVLLSGHTTSPLAQPAQQIATFSADPGQSRRIRLVDGSDILLSPGSSLDVSIGTGERRLRLASGEGRFSVAHEARPFVVEASGAEVVARGTQFVVSLAPGRTTVSLIEGRVDVSYADARGGGERRRVTRLAPGERLVVESGARDAVAEAPAADRRRPSAAQSAMLEFDDTPLAEAVEQANRHGSTRIRLVDPAIANLRITGAFRAGDTNGFAESVAAAFGLELERSADGLWLSLRAARSN